MKIYWKKHLLFLAVAAWMVGALPAADAAPDAAAAAASVAPQTEVQDTKGAATAAPAAPQTEVQNVSANASAESNDPLATKVAAKKDDNYGITPKMGFWEKIQDSCYTNFVKDGRWRYLAQGFLITMEISLAAVLLGVIIGFIVAVIRSVADQTGKYKILNGICKVYLTVIRGTPMVVQLLIIYFVIFGACDVSKVLVAIIAFGVNSGAYVTEIIRSGINAIDPGQLEAGRSLGLSYLQTMRLVILPQAFKNVLPALGNEFIALLKETSISGYIALQDLTKGGDIIRSQTYDAFLPLTAVAIIYLAVVMLFTKLLGILERKLKKNER